MTSLKPAGVLQMASTQLRRDLRTTELRLVMVAIALAVAALTAVAFFASRLQAGLNRDAAALLGGDAVVAADQPLPPAFRAQAQAMGLAVAETATFPSMARTDDAHGGQARLASVKAVSEAYPLRGRLTLGASDPKPAPGITLPRRPASGQAWADAALLDALGLRVGDTLLLGDAALRVSAVIETEPDRGAGFLSLAPRVMVALEDLPATGLVQPASRVTWRLAVAANPGRGAASAVAGFVAWTQQQVDANHLRGVRIETLDNGRPEMRQTLARADQFLRLVAVLAALLCAVAVGIASRGFALQRLDASAMLRVLGLPQRRIASAYAVQFVAVGLLASTAGVLIGLVVQQAFVALLSGLVEASLPAPGWAPAAMGLGAGLCLVTAFGLPPVLQLASVPPLRVIRRELGQPAAGSVLVLGTGMAGFAALLFLAAGDTKLGSITVGGFAASWLVFAGVAWAAVRLLGRVVPVLSGPRWLLLATRQLAARPALVVLQVSALSLGLTALALLVLLRTDLVDSWRAATPPDAPNRFVINIQPDQDQPLQQRLRGAGVTSFDWYPMIRGRLVAVNNRPVQSNDYADDRARRLVEREFNLSHTATLPAHNDVTAGDWRANEPDGLSVESGLAETLGLHLGDRLRFDVGGTMAEGRITSLRKVDWTSMRVNFFVLFPLADMPGLPLSYITAFRAPATPGFDSGLARDFPNLTVVDVSAQVAQVQKVLDQVIGAVEFLFAFTLAAGVLVLFGTMSLTRAGRERELALMRAMGAPTPLLRQVQRAELAGIGSLAGVLAAAAAAVIGWGLARQVFNFDWHPSPLVPLAGAVAGGVLAWAAGWLVLRGVLNRPVSQTLRRHGAGD